MKGIVHSKLWCTYITHSSTIIHHNTTQYYTIHTPTLNTQTKYSKADIIIIQYNSFRKPAQHQWWIQQTSHDFVMLSKVIMYILPYIRTQPVLLHRPHQTHILQYGTVRLVHTDTVFVYSTQHNIVHFVGYTATDTAVIQVAYSCVFPGAWPTIAFSAWLSFYTLRRHTHVGSNKMTHPHNICLAKIFADAKHACLIVKNYDSPTERTSCIIFADVKHACFIIKNYDSLTEFTFCEHFMQCKMWHT